MKHPLEAIWGWFTNSDNPAIAAQKCGLIFASWWNEFDMLRTISILFVCLQVYFLLRDRLRKRRHDKKYVTKPGDLS